MGEERRDRLMERHSCLLSLSSFQQLRSGFSDRLQNGEYLPLAIEVSKAGRDADTILPSRNNKQTAVSRAVKPAIRDLSNRLCSAAQLHVSESIMIRGSTIELRNKAVENENKGKQQQAGGLADALDAMEMCKEGAGRARLEQLLVEFWKFLKPLVDTTHVVECSGGSKRTDGGEATACLALKRGDDKRTEAASSSNKAQSASGGLLEDLHTALAFLLQGLGLKGELAECAGAWLQARLGHAALSMLLGGAPDDGPAFARCVGKRGISIRAWNRNGENSRQQGCLWSLFWIVARP
jgi:hypothetical protein